MKRKRKREAEKNKPTMAAQIIGSVGVKQAVIARQDIKSNLGNSARKSPVHPPLNIQ
jgi:hypothetical protein